VSEPKPHILFLEDDKALRETFSSILSDSGYCVLSFDNLDEAMEYFDKFRPDIIVSDINLRNRSGLELLTYISNKSNECKVIFITGYATLSTSIEAVNKGAFAYLVKPVEIETLISFISNAYELIKRKRQNEELMKKLLKREQDLKKALQKANELSEKLNYILKSMAQGLIFFNRKGKIDIINEFARKLFYIENEDDRASEIIKKSTPIYEMVEKVMKSEHSLTDEFVFESPFSQKEIPLYVKVSPCNEGIIVVLDNISRIKSLRKEIQEAEHLAKFGSFAAHIAHEIRTPLSAIKTLIQFLKLKIEKKEYLSKLNIVLSELNRIELLMDSFLNFAHLKIKSIEKVEVDSLLVTILASLDKKLKSKNLKVNISKNLKSDIYFDRNVLFHVLSNLISNAVEFANSVINVIITQKSKNLILEVENDGEKIERKIKNKIFEPFFSTRNNGIGLGLSIVKKLVDLTKGEIDVFSKNGLTCFKIIFPTNPS